MAQWLRSQAADVEDPGSSLSSHMVAHNCLTTVLVNLGFYENFIMCTCIHNGIHSYTKIYKFIKLKTCNIIISNII